MLEIVMYFLVAVFIFSRLYNSLGKTSDINLHVINKTSKTNNINFENIETILVNDDEKVLASFQNNQASIIRPILENMRSLDKSFSLTNFLDGATSAFEIILKAYNENNRPVLKSLLDDKIYNSFIKDLDEKGKSGNFYHCILVAIKNVEIIDLKLIKNIGYIVVRFLSEQINFVKDKDDQVISGSISKTIKVEDLWQFTRDFSSSSPKWLLLSSNHKVS